MANKKESENEPLNAKNEAKDILSEVSGVKDWKSGSKIGTLTGYSNIKRAVTSTVTGLKDGLGFIRGSAKFFKRDKVHKLATTSTDPKERFLVAMDKYNRNFGYVENAVQRTRMNFFIYIVLTGVMFFLGYFVFSSDGTDALPPVVNLIWAFSVVPLTFILAVNSAFYNYQFRNKALYSFKSFLSNHTEWVPRKMDNSFF